MRKKLVQPPYALLVDKNEARGILEQTLSDLHRISYNELRARIPPKPRRVLFLTVLDEPQVETHVFWDGPPDNDIRVTASIDDGGLRAFKPLSDGFIRRPEGSEVP